MNDVAASMGLVGLRHSDEILNYRKELCLRYKSNLSDVVDYVCGGSYWLFAVLLNNRDSTIEALREKGVECDLIQLRNDIFKVFGGERQNLPNMNSLESQYLYLPLNCKVTQAEVDYISDMLRLSYKRK